MGPYGSTDFKALLLLQITAKSFQTSPEFLPNGHHKTTVGIFKILKIEILMNSFSLTWDPMGAKISKRYSSYKSQPKAFKLFLNFLLNGPHKTAFGIFKILKIEILMIFFVFLDMGPYGNQNFFKTLLVPQISYQF